MRWISRKEQLPPEGEVVETKIDDSKGERNIQPLLRRGCLWYYPDDSMYVYYTPTHWRRAEPPPVLPGPAGEDALRAVKEYEAKQGRELD